MKNLLVVALSVFCFHFVTAQNRYSFEYTQDAKVYHTTDTLKNAWAGGLNYPDFSNIDLDSDGNLDLLAYDRSGNRIVPFLSFGSSGQNLLKFSPEHISAFPTNKSSGEFLLLRDFNCDGKQDIFEYDRYLYVYENTSQNGELSFQIANNGDYIESLFLGGSTTNVDFGADLPDINDIDGDGDIDILTFGLNGTSLEAHINTSTNCGLDFQQTTTCWGKFMEHGLNRAVIIDGCAGGGKRAPEKVQHAGSSLVSIDLNNNSIPDLLMGNVEFNNLSALYNGGSISDPHITSQDTMYPGSTPVDLHVFVSPYYADVTHDGVSDLIISTFNSTGSSSPDASNNYKGIWMYENLGSENQPNFNFVQENFLQAEMIDWGSSAVPRIVDINGDSLYDIILAIGSRYRISTLHASQLYYYQNTGTRQQPEFTLIDTNFADMLGYNLGENLVPAFGDLDDDGDLDMIIGSISGYFHSFKNTGSATNPSFQIDQSILTNTDVGANAAPYLYDIDYDDDLDLFVGNEQGKVYFFENSSKINAQFTLVSSTFASIDANQNTINGNAKPVFVEDSLGATLFVGSTNSGVIQYDNIDSVASLPPNFAGTFGSDTLVSLNANETPFGLAYRPGKNQFLITANELRLENFIYGSLESISFKVIDKGDQQPSNGFDIRILHTSKTELTDFEDMTDAHVAYQGFHSFNNGWNRITFDNAFIWDEKSNLIFEICFSGNFPGQNVQIEMSNTSYYSHAYGDAAGNNYANVTGCDLPFLNSIKKRPNFQLNLTPAATQVTNEAMPSILFTGHETAPDFADLNDDGFIDAVVGNLSGGLNLFYGKLYDVGINEIESINEIGFEIYPNPAKDQLIVEQLYLNGINYSDFMVYSLTGKLHLKGNIQGSKTEINVSELPAGIYLISLTGKDKIESSKFIIGK